MGQDTATDSMILPHLIDWYLVEYTTKKKNSKRSLAKCYFSSKKRWTNGWCNGGFFQVRWKTVIDVELQVCFQAKYQSFTWRFFKPWSSLKNKQLLYSLSFCSLPSLKRTQPLKSAGWKTTFLLRRPVFRHGVSFYRSTKVATFSHPRCPRIGMTTELNTS